MTTVATEAGPVFAGVADPEALHHVEDSPAPEKSPRVRRWAFVTAAAAVSMCLAALASLPFILRQRGPQEEVVLHVSDGGRLIDDADAGVLASRLLEEGSEQQNTNITVHVIDEEHGFDRGFSLLVERLDLAPLQNSDNGSQVALLINEREGGYAFGNHTFTALQCHWSAGVPSMCSLAEPSLVAGGDGQGRALLDDNEAIVAGMGIAVAGAVLITCIFACQGAVAASVSYGAVAATLSSGCFPGSARARTPAGHRLMRDLSVGTLLLTSQGFAPAYLNSHQDPLAHVQMVQVTTLSNHSLVLTPDHYLPLPGGHYRSAGQLAVGDELLVQAADDTFAPSPISSLELLWEQGLFNPLTTQGDLVVNGVLASCHSSWFLEGYLPESYIVPLYQAVLMPLRGLYRIAPCWMERFGRHFAGHPVALSEVGAHQIAATAWSALLTGS
jgi:hypothetical protein